MRFPNALLALAAVAALAAGCTSPPKPAAGPGGSSSSTKASTTTTSRTQSSTGTSTGASSDAQAAQGHVHHLADGLVYEDEVLGSGTMADPGLTVVVNYTGWLTNGNKFDSSYDRAQPFVFQLGAHQVISGWDEGVKGMRVGGKRKLTIPPDLGYGAQGAGGVIPPNSTLVFEVELLEVK